MYLCICKAVSDQQIRQAVERGVRTVGEMSVHFGVGVECGKCIDSIREFLDICLVAPANVVVDAIPLPATVEAVALLSTVGAAPSPSAADPAPQQAAWFAIDL